MTIWGFALGDGEVILNLIPINTEDNVLIALAGLAAGAASSTEPAVQAGWA